MIINKNESGPFLSETRELEPAGSLSHDKEYKFKFKEFDKQYESYDGIMTKVNYFLQVKIKKKKFGITTTEQKQIQPLRVWKLARPLGERDMMNLEVGMEGRLHIYFEFTKNQFHLTDKIEGKIEFVEIKLKLKQMEINMVRVETFGGKRNGGGEEKNFKKKVAIYEIMDGSPIKGRCGFVTF